MQHEVYTVGISDEKDSITILKAHLLSIAPVLAKSEVSCGKSTLRFLVPESSPIVPNPSTAKLSILVEWGINGTRLGLTLGHLGLIKGCHVREFRYDFSSKAHYLEFYLQNAYQDVKGWFEN